MTVTNLNRSNTLGPECPVILFYDLKTSLTTHL